VEVFYCDRCDEEIDPDREVYHVDGEDLCGRCYEDEVGDE
jgi:formylmethanofuran dehydrogenase subunit E